MVAKRGFTVSFDVHVRMQRRDDHWAAYMEPLGATVYGDTEQDAEARVNQAVNAFLNALSDQHSDDPAGAIRQYLDSHGVKHTIEYANTEPPQARHSYSRTVPMKTTVYA